MGLFGKKKKKIGWSGIYDDDLGFDPSEVDENPDPEDVVEELRGTVNRGPCMFCYENDAMVNNDDVCFICEKCGESIDYEGYLYWLAGYQLEFNEGDNWDDIY